MAELEQRFGYGLDELARRFDRSVSWVSRRLALAELLPEAIQQQVREGQVLAQVALKFLVPVARQSLADCQRMAAIFAQYHCDTRQAGQLYAAWRQGSSAIRKRILEEPELFFKTQRQEAKPSTTTAAALWRDLEMVAAIVNRAQRRLAGGAAAELDRQQCEAVRQQIDVFSGPKPFFSQDVERMHGGGRDQRSHDEARLSAKQNEFEFLARLQQVLT